MLMENRNVYKTPKKTLARLQVVHFGKITFNLQFVAMAFMIASVLSFFIYPVYYVMLIGVTAFTLGMIFVWYPNFKAWWTTDTLNKFTVWLARSWKYTVPIVMLLAAISIICLCFDKDKKKQAGRIAVAAILIVLAVIFLLIKAFIMNHVELPDPSE